MSITTNAELKTFLASASMRGDLAAVMQDFVNAAHVRIAADAQICADLTLNASSVALPTDFGRAVGLYVIAYPTAPVNRVSADQLATLQQASAGVPSGYDISGANLGLGPTPDQAYEGRLLYRVSGTFLAGDADTNAILKTYPMAYVYGALAELARFIFDPDLEAAREAAFAQAIERINQAELKKALEGAALQMQTSNSIV